MNDTKFYIDVFLRIISFLILFYHIIFTNYYKNENYKRLKVTDIILHIILLLIFAFNIFDVFLS